LTMSSANSVALLVGLSVVLSASYVNHKVATRFGGAMSAWYGWVVAVIIRFSAIIVSGLYVVIRSENGVESSGFMLTLLLAILAGLALDLFFSLYRVNSRQVQTERKVV